MQTGSLGNTVFQVSSAKVMTPNAISLSRDASFEDHKVQGSYPRPEFLAPGLKSVNLGLTLRADMGLDPCAEAEKLEQALIDGEVLRLVLAGQNIGKFTIRKIDQNWRYAMKSRSGPMILDLSLELREYW